jgi:hypothetical protein|tara:strand:- start:64 stop:360 length:297 start_codon:yes stop_codon:yes gene_type:complete
MRCFVAAAGTWAVDDRNWIIRNLTMFDNAKKTIRAITDIGISLLALAIVASLLVGSSNMSFMGDVVSNITALVTQLGNAGLSGLIALAVVLWLFQSKA